MSYAVDCLVLSYKQIFDVFVWIDNDGSENWIFAKNVFLAKLSKVKSSFKGNLTTKYDIF